MPRWLVLVSVVLFAGQTLAAEVGELYRGQAIVTGTHEPERTRGFRLALSDVIIKLTGDARLEGSDKLAVLLDTPHQFVKDFEYEDRMKDIPVHDEQGTRERPHFLRVRFKPAVIDAQLNKLGLVKWNPNRPMLAVWLAVRTARGVYVLERDGADGYGQRAVIVETARRRGLPITLPAAGRHDVRYDDVVAGDSAKLRRASPAAEGLLVAVLSIVPSGYWDIALRLDYRGRSRRWTLRNVSFDAALRNGLHTAALVLSGNAAM